MVILEISSCHPADKQQKLSDKMLVGGEEEGMMSTYLYM